MRYIAALMLFLALACAAASVQLLNTPEDQFAYAKKVYEDGKYDLAIQAFQTVVFRFHGTSLADSVKFYTGMCYYNQREYILAVSEFKQLLQNYPASPLADEAHYMVARSYFLDSPRNVGLEQDGIDNALLTLDNFFQDFPNSSYRQNARILQDSCYGRLAGKDYNNGVVYYKIGDLRAARIYFEEVVTKYSLQNWVGKSLYMLSEIDLKEKKFEDARAKLKNFIGAFPDHEWIDKARKKYDEIVAKMDKTETSPNERAQE